MIGIEFNDRGTVKKALEELDSLMMDPEEAVDAASTILISRIRRRYMQGQNPDGSPWPQSQAAITRRAGGYTHAKGGRFAPGGKRTGGSTLFASGNLFHSIQLVKTGRSGERSIMTDVDYAKYHQGRGGRTIIGVSNEDLGLVESAIFRRLQSGGK